MVIKQDISKKIFTEFCKIVSNNYIRSCSLLIQDSSDCKPRFNGFALARESRSAHTNKNMKSPGSNYQIDTFLSEPGILPIIKDIHLNVPCHKIPNWYLFVITWHIANYQGYTFECTMLQLPNWYFFVRTWHIANYQWYNNYFYVFLCSEYSLIGNQYH